MRIFRGFWRKKKKAPARSASRTRRSLRVEALESRWVFSAAGLEGALVSEQVCGPEPMAAIVAEGETAQPQLPLASAPLGPAYPPLIDNTQRLAADAPAATDDGLLRERPTTAEGESVPAPVITSFTNQFQGGYWMFEGSVSHFDPASLTIQFGGLLAGRSTYVDSYGYFYYNHTFPPGTVGQVSAQAFTIGGQSSNIEWTYVG